MQRRGELKRDDVQERSSSTAALKHKGNMTQLACLFLFSAATWPDQIVCLWRALLRLPPTCSQSPRRAFSSGHFCPRPRKGERQIRGESIRFGA